MGSYRPERRLPFMWPLMIATVCAGMFAGAAIYINAVEHPARLSCGNEIALRQFAPSYHRATAMQASLAVVGCLNALWSAWLLRGRVDRAGSRALGCGSPVYSHRDSANEQATARSVTRSTRREGDCASGSMGPPARDTKPFE